MKSRLAPLRVLIGVFLLFGLLDLGLMFWISTFAREGADFVTPLLPGHRFKPEILPRLGQFGGGSLGLGFALLIVERIVAAREKKIAALPEAERPVRPQQTPLQMGISVGLALLIGGVGLLGYKWWAYVAHAKSPYDEIGIELNSRAPGPINAWGCAQLKLRFERMIPPYGCAAPNGLWK